MDTRKIFTKKIIFTPKSQQKFSIAVIFDEQKKLQESFNKCFIASHHPKQHCMLQFMLQKSPFFIKSDRKIYRLLFVEGACLMCIHSAMNIF